MPRKKLVRSDTLPYHVTLRTNNRAPFPVPLDEAWRVLTDCCLEIHICHKAEIQLFVMMTNHLHLEVTTPASDLGEVMKTFGESATRTMNQISGRSGHLFGGPYNQCLIRDESHYRNVLRYVYQNPVRAGICPTVERYPYSTLQGLLGKAKLPFPLFYPRTGQGISLPSRDHVDLLDWMNRPVLPRDQEHIRRGLRRAEFKLPVDRISRKPVILETY